MKHSFPSLIAGAAVLALFAGCATGPSLGGSYHVTAYKPHNPGAVSVKVSTSTQHIYVMEGNRCLMAVQGCVGEPGEHQTPQGHWHIFRKDRVHRSGTFGFSSDGAGADAHKGQHVSVGYPMGFWCEFKEGYGFHQGYVWSIPRTHGCIRLHKEAAARLFALVHDGTPVDIASSQPEDATIGKTVQRLDQRNDPDPPARVLMSNSFFQDPPGNLLVEQ